MDGDAELAEDLPQVPAALGGEPVAEFAAGGEGDVQVRAGLGDLGRGLQAGEPAADHDHGLSGVQAGQALAQPQCPGTAGDLVGVLGDTGDALVVPAAAEGVHEGVVLQLLGLRLPRAVRVDDGDGPAVDVDAGDLRELQFDAGAREHLAEGPGPEILAGRELMHPDPLDEVGLGVDEGDGDVFTVQPPGEAAGGDGSGVAGSEDDDAVLHFRTPVSSGIRPLNRAARRFLTGTRCEARHMWSAGSEDPEQGIAVVGGRPPPGRAFELVGVDLVAERGDAVGGDLQAHDADDPAVEDHHEGGVAVGGRRVDVG